MFVDLRPLTGPDCDEQYYGGDAVGSSDICRALGASGPSGGKSILGRAEHMAILEPDKFLATYKTEPDECRPGSGKGQRERLKSWLECLGPDQVRMSRTEHDHCSSLLDLLDQRPDIAAIVRDPDTRIESSHVATDEETGLKVRWRPDAVRRGLILDVKGTKDPEYYAFMRSIEWYLYSVQAALYTDLETEAQGRSVGFLWVAHGGMPARIGTYMASPETLALGRRLYRAGLIALARERDRGVASSAWWEGSTLMSSDPTRMFADKADVIIAHAEEERNECESPK